MDRDALTVQKNVKNKGLERTCGHHQQHLQGDKTFILMNLRTPLHTAQSRG